MIYNRFGADRRGVGATAGEYRRARPVILRLSKNPMKICHLIHHVEQRLTRLFVVEWGVKEVRSKPALYSERIEKECPQMRVLFDFRHEVERRFLPPVHVARCEVLCGIPGVGDISPYDLIQVSLLAAR